MRGPSSSAEELVVQPVHRVWKIDLPQDHGAVFGATDAEQAGLPVIHADPNGDQ